MYTKPHWESNPASRQKGQLKFLQARPEQIGQSTSETMLPSLPTRPSVYHYGELLINTQHFLYSITLTVIGLAVWHFF